MARAKASLRLGFQPRSIIVLAVCRLFRVLKLLEYRLTSEKLKSMRSNAQDYKKDEKYPT